MLIETISKAKKNFIANHYYNKIMRTKDKSQMNDLQIYLSHSNSISFTVKIIFFKITI